MSMQDEEIRSVVARLARPHASGGFVIGRAALLAEGMEFAAIMAWIIDHGGTPEAMGAFMKAHGRPLDVTEAEATAIMLGIASGAIDERALEQWLFGQNRRG